MKAHVSEKELSLFKFFEAEYLLEERSIYAAYNALIIHVFLVHSYNCNYSQQRLDAIESLKLVYETLGSCKFYRETAEFDNLINF